MRYGGTVDESGGWLLGLVGEAPPVALVYAEELTGKDGPPSDGFSPLGGVPVVVGAPLSVDRLRKRWLRVAFGWSNLRQHCGDLATSLIHLNLPDET